MEKWVVIILVFLITPIVVIAGVAGVVIIGGGGSSPDTDDMDSYNEEYGDLGSNLGTSQPNYDPHNLRKNYTVQDGPGFRETGYCHEGPAYYYNFSLALDGGRYLESITFRLNWTDEPDKEVGLVELPNEPDGFRMYVEWLRDEDVPDSQDIYGDCWGENPHGQEGCTGISFQITHTMLEVQRGEGPWSVRLTVQAGDYGKTDKPLYPSQEDAGNDFTLTVTTTVYVPK